MPAMFSLPWLHFVFVILVTVLLMLPLTEIFSILGLVLSFVVGAVLYLLLYAFNLLDKVKYYGMLDFSIKRKMTSVCQTGQAILWE
jgi:hypothetical protein